MKKIPLSEGFNFYELVHLNNKDLKMSSLLVVQVKK